MSVLDVDDVYAEMMASLGADCSEARFYSCGVAEVKLEQLVKHLREFGESYIQRGYTSIVVERFLLDRNWSCAEELRNWILVLYTMMQVRYGWCDSTIDFIAGALEPSYERGSYYGLVYEDIYKESKNLSNKDSFVTIYFAFRDYVENPDVSDGAYEYGWDGKTLNEAYNKYRSQIWQGR
jgi:hypothetical protein